MERGMGKANKDGICTTKVFPVDNIFRRYFIRVFTKMKVHFNVSFREYIFYLKWQHGREKRSRP